MKDWALIVSPPTPVGAPSATRSGPVAARTPLQRAQHLAEDMIDAKDGFQTQSALAAAPCSDGCLPDSRPGVVKTGQPQLLLREPGETASAGDAGQG